MFGALPGSTTELHAPLADSAAHSCRGEQRSNRPTDARDSTASGHHAIPGWQCTPRRSIAFAAGSAMSATRRVDECHAKTGIMWSPARRRHPSPAPKIGFSTATPHKTVLQIMRSLLCRDRHKAHLRRRFYEVYVGGNAPIATEALARIKLLYDIEAE